MTIHHNASTIGAAAGPPQRAEVERWSRRRALTRLGLGVSVFASIAPLVLTGCAQRITASVPTASPPSGAEAPAGHTPARVEATLTMTTWETPTGGGTIYQQQADNFHREHPDIKISVQSFPTNYPTKIQTMIAGDVPPDLFGVNVEYFAKFAQDGVLHTLDSYINADHSFDVADFYPAVFNYFHDGGHQYGVPKAWNPDPVLYYNKALFDAAHLPYPTAQWTWNDLLTAAQHLTKRSSSGPAQQFGFARTTDWQVCASFIWMNGGAFFSADNRHCLLDQPAAQEALQWSADLSNKWRVVPSVAELTVNSQQNLFATGKIAMMTGIRGTIKQLRTVHSFGWDVTLFPKGTAGRVYALLSSCFSISAHSAHASQAWDFLAYLNQPSTQVAIAALGGGMPTRQSVAKGTEWRQPNLPPANESAYVEAGQDLRALPILPAMQAISNLFNKQTDYLWRGERPAASVTAAMVPPINQLLASTTNPS
ncbi:MAG: sugar ABC transporter substrate-binding protein [Chloroflexi bacterium]|nr:sugar ABC transporter substrate-binding protein [Chloroflexota bacterium]